MGKQAVYAGDADVIEPDNFVAVDLGGQSGFLRDGDVAGSAGGDDDLTDTGRLRHRADNGSAGVRVIGKRVRCGYAFSRLRREPGDQNGPLSGCKHGVQDPRDLLRRLARAVDHLRRPLTGFAVEIHLGVAEICKGGLLQLQQRVIHGDDSVPNALQQAPGLAVHVRTSKSSVTPS